MKSHCDDRVTVSLTIESVSLTPAMLTTRLGVHPDEQWLAGASRGQTGKQWEHNGWTVETTVRSAENAGISATKLIPRALIQFETRVRHIADMIAALSDSVQVYTVLFILTEHVPGIELSPSFLQLLADIGGTFQVDLSIPPNGST